MTTIPRIKLIHEQGYIIRAPSLKVLKKQYFNNKTWRFEGKIPGHPLCSLTNDFTDVGMVIEWCKIGIATVVLCTEEEEKKYEKEWDREFALKYPDIDDDY